MVQLGVPGGDRGSKESELKKIGKRWSNSESENKIVLTWTGIRTGILKLSHYQNRV